METLQYFCSSLINQMLVLHGALYDKHLSQVLK